jgi:hypothetical protein
MKTETDTGKMQLKPGYTKDCWEPPKARESFLETSEGVYLGFRLFISITETE